MIQNKKTVLALVALAALIAIIIGVWVTFAPKGTAGSKNITVEVVYADKTSKSFAMQSSAEFLRGALEEQKLVEGTESSYGLFVTVVDGVAADEAKQEWWYFTKNGAMLEFGLDATPIADGDQFEITLTTGY